MTGLKWRIFLIGLILLSYVLIKNAFIRENINLSESQKETIIYSVIIEQAVNHIIDFDYNSDDMVIVNMSVPTQLRSELQSGPELLYENNWDKKLLFYIGDTIPIDRFVSLDTLMLMNKKMASLSEETLVNYKLVNKTEQTITNSFETKIKFKVVEKEEIKRIFNNQMGWSEFSKTFPNTVGHLAFSKIGFDQYNQQALVYTEFWCGGQCGEGAYWLLSKKGEFWKIDKKVTNWLS